MLANELRKQKIAEWHNKTLAEPQSAVYAEMVGSPSWALPFWGIPEYMHDGICRWVLFGAVPGDFLQAVLRHDLMGAAMKADDINKGLLYEYAKVMYNAMPPGSHGPDCFSRWKGVFPENEDDTAGDPGVTVVT
jgi:hypothetical protein